MTGILVLLRHGQSTWNAQNLFTGWHDVPLTQKGEQEAKAAGETLLKAGIVFDLVFTSMQIRAIETNRIALSALGQSKVDIRQDWHLNERHYGALQGLDKKATTAKYGAEQTNIWRRSYDTAPPPVDISSPEHPTHDLQYKNIPVEKLPASECLKDVVNRVVPYFEANIAPELKNNKNILITAHGNSLRALVMSLEKLSPQQISEFNIPTGVPRRYEFLKASNNRSDAALVIKNVEYLGDQSAIAAAAQAVADQSANK